MAAKKFTSTGYIPPGGTYVAPPSGLVGALLFTNGIHLALDDDGVPYYTSHADYAWATLIKGDKGDPGDIGSSTSLGNVSGAINLSGYTLAAQTFLLTATGNLTLAPAGMPVVPAGKSGSFTLEITQDGTGSRTLTNDAAILSAYGIDPVLTTTAAAKDLVHYFYDGVRWVCFIGGQALA